MSARARATAFMRAALLVGLVCATTSTACWLRPTPEPKLPEPKLPVTQERMRTVVLEWLECEECVDGELQAVLALGRARAVPTLAAALREGPAPGRRQRLERELRARFDERRGGRGFTPDDLTREQYVRQYLDNYDALVRIRAANALGLLGGEDAREALQEAKLVPHRQDVAEVTRRALALLESGPGSRGEEPE